MTRLPSLGSHLALSRVLLVRPPAKPAKFLLVLHCLFVALVALALVQVAAPSARVWVRK